MQSARRVWSTLWWLGQMDWLEMYKKQRQYHVKRRMNSSKQRMLNISATSPMRWVHFKLKYNVLHLMNNWYWNISQHLTYSACFLTYTTPPPTHYTNFKTTWILCSISFTLPPTPTHFSYPQQRKITHNKSKKWTQFCDLQLLLHFIYISNAQFSISSDIFTLKLYVLCIYYICCSMLRRRKKEKEKSSYKKIL